MGIKHPFTSSKTDQSDTTKVRPSIWNSDHVIDSDVDYAGHSVTNANEVNAADVITTDVHATTVYATDVIVADEAYNQAAWDGSLEAPTKNAVRDKIEALVLGGGGVTDFLGLDDTPDSYPGQAGKGVRVNALETALEFGATGVTPRGPTLTISGGAITVTHSFHYVDTEGLASYDTLDTINGGVDGQRLVLCAANASRAIYLSDNVGNLMFRNGGFMLNGDMNTGGDNHPTIELMYDALKTKWIEVSRFGGRAYTGVKNVKDYGAKGDFFTDDTAAIQAAIDDVDPSFSGIYQGNLNRGTILFPAGSYLVTAPLTFGDAAVKFLGEGGPRVFGNFNGFIFHGSGGANKYGHSFEHLNIANGNTTNVTSGCIFLDVTIAVEVKNCAIHTPGGVGVRCYQDVTCNTCSFNGDGIGGAGGVGVVMGNAAAVIDCDFTNWSGSAITHDNLGSVILGGRFEVNEIGITLGVSPSFAPSSSAGVLVSGCSMESNNIHIWCANVANTVISGVGTQSFNAGNTHGFFIQSARGLHIDSCGLSGSAVSVASIRVQSSGTGWSEKLTISNTGAFSWSVDDNIDTTSWVNTDYEPAFTNKYSDITTVGSPKIPRPIAATIASGAITVTGNYMVIDTEGAAATDDLDTISGSVAGQHGSRLVLRAANSARTVVVKDGTGNLHLAGDCSLDNVQDTIELIWDAGSGGLNAWLEIGRSDNGA